MTAFASLWLALCFVSCFLPGANDAAAAQTGIIEIRSASFSSGEDGYTLNADLNVALSPVLDDALNKGVPLYFVLEFEIVRPRWYWLNEKIVNTQQPIRLSYNTLTRQYRVGAGALYQNFPPRPKRSIF